MVNYEAIEQQLIKLLTSWNFEKEDSYHYSKKITGDCIYQLDFDIPADDGDLFITLDINNHKEKYAMCYISLHAKGKRYIEEVLTHLLKKMNEPLPQKIITYFLSDNK